MISSIVLVYSGTILIWELDGLPINDHIENRGIIDMSWCYSVNTCSLMSSLTVSSLMSSF